VHSPEARYLESWNMGAREACQRDLPDGELDASPCARTLFLESCCAWSALAALLRRMSTAGRQRRARRIEGNAPKRVRSTQWTCSSSRLPTWP